MFQGIPVVLRLAGWFPENGDPPAAAGPDGISPAAGHRRHSVRCRLRSHGGRLGGRARTRHGKPPGRHVLRRQFHRRQGTLRHRQLRGRPGPELDRLADSPDIRTAGDIDPDTIVQPGVLVGPGISLGALIALWCFAWYRLTRKITPQFSSNCPNSGRPWGTAHEQGKRMNKKQADKLILAGKKSQAARKSFSSARRAPPRSSPGAGRSPRRSCAPSTCPTRSTSTPATAAP